jgi:hypothetical protein
MKKKSSRKKVAAIIPTHFCSECNAARIKAEVSKPTDKHLKINITVPAWILPKIDRAAREMHMTRSAFFRWAAKKKMESES